MKEQDKLKLAEAVLSNTIVSYNFNTKFTMQDLLHSETISKTDIEKLHSNVIEQLEKQQRPKLGEIKAFIVERLEKERGILELAYNFREEKERFLKEANETAKHNREIDALIIKKQQENLGNLSVEELEKLKK